MKVSEPIHSVMTEYKAVRSRTLQLCAPLAVEDHIPQSMLDASPTKWHLAHTTWFFERFVLQKFDPSYKVFNPGFEYLFNSYYNAVGERVARGMRGLMTRPILAEVHQYREHVDAAMMQRLQRMAVAEREQGALEIQLGLQHEMQHQELLVTDFKNLLSQNPLAVSYYRGLPPKRGSKPDALTWVSHPGGLHSIGADSDSSQFAYDNEGPRHQVYLQPFRLASRTVTNGEYLKFVRAGGYQQAEHWLSLGWDKVQAEDWAAPLYWSRDLETGEWQEFSLWGLHALDENAPVCHLSFFEADAYARWMGARLPTEGEWEVLAAGEAVVGNFGHSSHLHPRGSALGMPCAIQDAYGDVWEWTQSAYAAYPGYAPLEGALGEYNGKFMSNQMVLRGGSCATPDGHLRSTYRNFFPSDARWQFSGVRLAQDV